MTRKSSEVISNDKIDNIILEYDELLKFLKDELSYNNISKTKLQKLKNKANQGNLSFDDECKLYANINRFKRIKSILELKRDDLNQETLKRMLAGSEDSSFYSDSSEDAFFELDFASRLINLPNYKSINIKTEADIIFNESIVVECKKIHSKNSFEKNIKKANSQIINRVNNNLASKGFISIDITNIFDHEKIKEFTKYTFPIFYEEYLNLGHPENGCIKSIVTDKNFRMIFQGFSTALLEFAFHSMFKKIRNNVTLNENVMGIFFQAETFFPLETETAKMLIAQRLGTYHINDSYIQNNKDKETTQDVSAFFRSLPSGI